VHASAASDVVATPTPLRWRQPEPASSQDRPMAATPHAISTPGAKDRPDSAPMVLPPSCKRSATRCFLEVAAAPAAPEAAPTRPGAGHAEVCEQTPAPGTPPEAAGLQWPSTFCEEPRGERLELTEGGTRATRSGDAGRAVAFLGPLQFENAGTAYFEVEVVELESTRRQTVAIGVCTELPPSSSGRLFQERARDLGAGSYLIGYDLPKLFADGKDVAKVNTREWRPLKDLVVGDRLGLLVERHSARLTVFVNGRRRVHLSLPPTKNGTLTNASQLWGVVDVHGNLRSVRLRQQTPATQEQRAASPELATLTSSSAEAPVARTSAARDLQACRTTDLAEFATQLHRDDGGNVAEGATQLAHDATFRQRVDNGGRCASAAMPPPQSTPKARAASCREATDLAARPTTVAAAPVTAGSAAKRRRVGPRFACGCIVHLIRHTGTVVHVPVDEFVIGRNPMLCNLTLDSPDVPGMVSRRHARIFAAGDGGEVVLVDCGSLNGTFVNSRRVSHEMLKQDDVVVIGLPAMCPPEFCFTVSLPQSRAPQ